MLSANIDSIDHGYARYLNSTRVEFSSRAKRPFRSNDSAKTVSLSLVSSASPNRGNKLSTTELSRQRSAGRSVGDIFARLRENGSLLIDANDRKEIVRIGYAISRDVQRAALISRDYHARFDVSSIHGHETS